MDEWVCRACGATYTDETTPCLQCASDRVTHVDDDATEDYSQDPVAFRCENCGNVTPRHAPPCDRCGSMTFETVHGDDVHETADALPDSWYDPLGPLYALRRRLWTLTTYTIGAAAVAAFFAVAGSGEAGAFGAGLLRLMLAIAAIEVLVIVLSIAYDHLHERNSI